MTAVRELTRGELPAYAPLTFPLYRHLLAAPPADREMVYAGLPGPDGEPLALAFGMGGPNGEYELISISVGPFHRRQGHGRALLSLVERRFAALGYRTGVQFFTLEPADQGYARFLMRCGWGRPQVRQLLCRTSLDKAYETPWLVRARLAEGERVLDWTEVPEAARAALKAEKAGNPGLFPDLLDPFQHEQDCDHATSVALLRGDRLAGWILTHRLDAELLRWTCSYVRPELQGAGRILPLWWAAVQRQRERTTLPRFVWAVPVELPRMARFAARRMKPHLESLGYACIALKPAEEAAAQPAAAARGERCSTRPMPPKTGSSSSTPSS